MAITKPKYHAVVRYSPQANHMMEYTEPTGDGKQTAGDPLPVPPKVEDLLRDGKKVAVTVYEGERLVSSGQRAAGVAFQIMKSCIAGTYDPIPPVKDRRVNTAGGVVKEAV